MHDFCDLHTHSYYSDGTASPAQIVEAAARMGLSAVALTDHNTVAGLPEFMEAAAGRIPEAIPGVEISTGYLGAEVHIVGLFIEPSMYEKVTDFVDISNKRKEESNKLLVRNLAQAGLVLDYEEIKANHQGNVNRAVIAAALVEKGYVATRDEAFTGVLSKKMGYYVPPERIAAMEAIAFLKSIHAVPVLAHPFLSLTEEELHKFLPEAKEHGLAAMETRYSKYSEETTAAAIGIAEEYGLLESGGSDYHGGNKPDIQLGTGRGDMEVPDTLLRELRRCL